MHNFLEYEKVKNALILCILTTPKIESVNLVNMLQDITDYFKAQEKKNHEN